MLNALERATIAKHVSDYIIEHLLIEQSMRSYELERLARNIAEDKLSDPGDIEKVTRLALARVSEDPRILVWACDDKRTLWIYHKEFAGP